VRYSGWGREIGDFCLLTEEIVDLGQPVDVFQADDGAYAAAGEFEKEGSWNKKRGE